jgi:hypothetical protein
MDREKFSMKRNEVNLAAVIGGSAVVALGVLGGAMMQAQAGPASVTSSEMSTGVTVTESAAPNAPAIPVATPAIKGPAPLPLEEQGLPG